MEQEKIICPNCGAENDYGGTCKYCGGLLHAQSNISVGDELEDQPLSLNDEKYKYFDEKFDRIEKITWSTRSLSEYFVHLESECSSSGKKRVFIKVRGIECSNGLPQALVFNLHGKIYRIDRERYIVYDNYKDVKCYKIYFEINANILKELCEVSGKLETKILFPNTAPRRFWNECQITARLFYNKLFDDSAYLETLMDTQKWMDEEPERKKQEEEKRKQEEEKRKQKMERELQEEERKKAELADRELRNSLIMLIIIFISAVVFFCCVLED